MANKLGENNMKKIIIFGGSGFIGQNLAKALKELKVKPKTWVQMSMAHRYATLDEAFEDIFKKDNI